MTALVNEGVGLETLDKAMKSFGMPVGPITLSGLLVLVYVYMYVNMYVYKCIFFYIYMIADIYIYTYVCIDEVGIDVSNHVGTFMSKADLGVRMEGGNPQFMKTMVEKGWLGKKTGTHTCIYAYNKC